MKKILMLAVVFALAATSSFADVSSGTTGTMLLTTADTGLELHADSATATKTTELIGKCSTGVGIGWKTEVAGYALITQHVNGTKAYASSYDSTSLYSIIATKGTVKLGVPTKIDTSDFIATGWTAM